MTSSVRSFLSERVREFCDNLYNTRPEDDFSFISHLKWISGFPNSSEETAELIELLQTEQSLIHSVLSSRPGNPSVRHLALAGRLASTADLLKKLQTETSMSAVFPPHGHGYRARFGKMVQAEIDTLAALSARESQSLQPPPGLPVPKTAVSLSSIKAPQPSFPKTPGSNQPQVWSPAPPLSVGSSGLPNPSVNPSGLLSPPKNPKAILATTEQQAILAQQAKAQAILAPAADPFSLANLAVKMKQVKDRLKVLGAGVGSLSSKSSSKSNSNSESVSTSNTGTSSSSSTTKTTKTLSLIHI